MSAKLTIFTVSGRHSFPVDMLRYDACFPKTPVSAQKLTRSIKGQPLNHKGDPYEIELCHMDAFENAWVPTYERWSSFGYTASNVKRVEL